MSSSSESSPNIPLSSSCLPPLEESGDEDPLREIIDDQVKLGLQPLYIFLLAVPCPPKSHQGMWDLFLTQVQHMNQPLDTESRLLWSMWVQSAQSIEELEWISDVLSRLKLNFIDLNPMWSSLSQHLIIRLHHLTYQKQSVSPLVHSTGFLRRGINLILFLFSLGLFLYIYQRWIKVSQSGIDLW